MTTKSTTHSFGILYIVGTPIGNLQDITERAIQTLKKVDKIAAEDTRHSAHLLATYGISTPLVSLHEHNEAMRATQLINYLKEGQSIALISDAGTPLISDPGYTLVKEVRKEGIRIEPIPGACAAIAALSVSGLPTDRFVFEGFLSSKTAPRKAHLERLLAEPRTLVFYEAPHRILDSLKAMQSVWGGDREIVIARELTKLFETVYAGTIDEVITWMKNDKNQQRGEMVIIVAGNTILPVSAEKTISSDHVLRVLLESLSLKEAALCTAKITGEKKNELYQRALVIKSGKL